eukprot:2831491-Prymnesium_polylepis.1
MPAGGKDTAGALSHRIKLFSAKAQVNVQWDIDVLAARLQPLGDLPGLSGGSQQRAEAEVAEATFVLFDTSTSMQD